MGLGKDLDLYMTSEGRRIDWGDLGKVQGGGTIDVGFGMKGGGMKRKTNTGNHWESFRDQKKQRDRGEGGCLE